MYGLGGMAKNALKKSFIDHNTSKSNDVDIIDIKEPLGHIEKRAAARSLINYENRPVKYIPPRIKQTNKKNNLFKGSKFTGCSYTNGTITNTVLTNCNIDIGDINLTNPSFTNATVTGTATINLMKVTKMISDLIPSVTKTYDIGTNSLQWRYIYGQYIDASYGFYIGETTNNFQIIRTGEASDTVMTNTTGNLIIDNTNATGSTIERLGTDTSATSFKVQNNTEADLFSITGDGNVDLAIHDGSSVGLKLGGTLVTPTATELNVMDGDTSSSSVTLIDSDKFVINDGGVMKQVPLSDIKTYVAGMSMGYVGDTIYFDGNLVVNGTVTSTQNTVVGSVTVPDPLTSLQVWNESLTLIYPINHTKTVLIGTQSLIDDGDTTNILEVTGKTKTTGRILCCDATDATNTTDGSVYTAGGLSVVKSAVFGSTVTANQFIMSSDERLKKRIEPIKRDLNKEILASKFNKLRPVKFKWRKKAQTQSNEPAKENYQYGFTAQNILKEFPECAFEKADGYLGIDYAGITSVVILKMQDQQEEIVNQTQEIKKLRDQNELFKNLLKKQDIVMNNLLQRMEKIEMDIQLEEVGCSGSKSSDTDSNSSGCNSFDERRFQWEKDYDRDRDRNGGGGGGRGGFSNFSKSY